MRKTYFAVITKLTTEVNIFPLWKNSSRQNQIASQASQISCTHHYKHDDMHLHNYYTTLTYLNSVLAIRMSCSMIFLGDWWFFVKFVQWCTSALCKNYNHTRTGTTVLWKIIKIFTTVALWIIHGGTRHWVAVKYGLNVYLNKIGCLCFNCTKSAKFH